MSCAQEACVTMRDRRLHAAPNTTNCLERIRRVWGLFNLLC